jgi:hypothetical protein
MTDSCCHVCRSQFGVCLTGYRCEHHISARITEAADDRARRLYNNPTQDQAIENVMREKRRQRR